MESLPGGIILEFNANTLQAVRTEVNLDDPKRLNEAIDLLESWMKKQNHFVKKDFSREFLERTIIASKGLVERAKKRLDRYCTFKTIMPEFFNNTDISSIYDNKFIVHGHLPKLTPDNYRVYFSKLDADGSDPSVIFKYYQYTIKLSEYVRKYDYCSGFILILDYTDTAILAFIAEMDLVQFRQALNIFIEGYGMRVKGIHIITPSKMVDALISLFKSVLSEKLSKRIYVHKTVDTVYEHVPKDILPVEYGGQERSLKTLQEDWFKIIASKENQEYLKEINAAKTNESYRQTDKFNDDYIGMPGSFRSLSVD